jgi:predicted acylesterase/phospholipase RssA
MPRRFQFQLAIEGGGARLADLLTALTVIQEYEQKKKIQITRLAGTSAGALAACVYACGGDSCQRALDYLEERAPHASKRILPKINTWNWISKILPRLLLGRSLCNENLIKSEIDSLFQKVLRTNSQNIIINDLMKTSPNLERLNIITTDMRSYRARSIYGENENLTEALFNSCAIPVVFKGAKSLVQPFVDGGLCENLPSDFLDVGQAEVVQPILAITFENKAPKYKQINTIKFIRELFSVAINNSVYRARSALPPQSILSLSTNTDVFDFANAFDATSRQGDFDSIKLRTEAWLERNIRLENSKSSNKIFSFVPGNKAAEEIMIGLRKWYLKTHSNVKRNVLRDVTIITAHSLSETSDHPVDRLDDI